MDELPPQLTSQAARPQPELIPYEPRADKSSPEQGAALKRRYPDDPRSYFVAAYDAAFVCDHALAEENIRRALAMAEQHPAFQADRLRIAHFRSMLAGTLFIQRKYDDALEQHNILVDDDPRNVELIFQRSKNLFAMRRYGAVRANADRLIDLEPASFKGYLMRASANYREGKFPAAVTDFMHANTRWQESPTLMIQLGMAQAANGQYRAALATYDAALVIERREEGDSALLDDILIKRSHAAAALAAVAALGANDHDETLARIRADLYAADVPPDTPTNSLGCKG